MKNILTSALALAALTMPAGAESFSVELFAGSTFATEFNLNGNLFDIASDDVVGIRGLYSVTPNIAVGLEYRQTAAVFTTLFQRSMDVEALSAIARYTIPVNDRLGVYGTLGVSRVSVHYINTIFTDSGTFEGGTLALGASYAVTDTVGVFAEWSALTVFGDFELRGDILEYTGSSVNLGVRVRF